MLKNPILQTLDTDITQKEIYIFVGIGGIALLVTIIICYLYCCNRNKKLENKGKFLNFIAIRESWIGDYICNNYQTIRS